jgi:hypothetical protein
MAKFKNQSEPLTFVSLYEPEVRVISPHQLQLTPLLALTWNDHDPTQCMVTRYQFLQSILPSMNTDRIYQQLFLDWVRQYKHQTVKHDARIRQAGRDLRKMIEPILMGKQTAVHWMQAVQPRLNQSQQFANQEALDTYNERCATYEKMKQEGKWTPPLDHNQRMFRVSKLPDMEDLFHPTHWPKLTPCMRGVLAHAQEKGHLKNDERQAMAEWLVYSRPHVWDEEIHMNRIRGNFEGQNERSFKSAIHYASDRRGEDRRYSCSKIIHGMNTRAPESRLMCPYATTPSPDGLSPQRCCARDLGLPENVVISDPFDGLLMVWGI